MWGLAQGYTLNVLVCCGPARCRGCCVTCGSKGDLPLLAKDSLTRQGVSHCAPRRSLLPFVRGHAHLSGSMMVLICHRHPLPRHASPPLHKIQVGRQSTHTPVWPSPWALHVGCSRSEGCAPSGEGTCSLTLPGTWVEEWHPCRRRPLPCAHPARRRRRRDPTPPPTPGAEPAEAPWGTHVGCIKSPGERH